MNILEETQPFFIATLPLPPGVNHSYRIVRYGRAHRLAATPELEAFKLLAASKLKQHLNEGWEVVQQIQQSKQKTPLYLELIFFYPTLWLHDIDGGIKAVQDAACKHLGLNDNLIVDLHASKRVDRKNPRVEVKLYHPPLQG